MIEDTETKVRIMDLAARANRSHGYVYKLIRVGKLPNPYKDEFGFYYTADTANKVEAKLSKFRRRVMHDKWLTPPDDGHHEAATGTEATTFKTLRSVRTASGSVLVFDGNTLIGELPAEVPTAG